MYIVKLKNGDNVTEIHNASEKLKSGSVVKGINSIDSFSFTLLPSNIGFNMIRDFSTLVEVYNTNKNRYEFQGRVLYSRPAMDENGLITKEVICESYFGFLCDSRQKYVSEKNWTVRELLQAILDAHNSQVEEYKHFTIGELTVEDPNDNLYIGIQRENTWKTIEEKLIKKLGGEIRFRTVDGVIYFDYLKEIGETRSTKIKKSWNMKSISQENNPTTFVTRLIPLGVKLKDENGNDSEERLTIKSVNDGLEYIDVEEAIEDYGIHVEYAYFDDVNSASLLMKKGRDWLSENNRVQVKYSISALDLSLLGLDIDDFNVCDYHPIENDLLGINDTARIIKKNINVTDETSSTIEVGDKYKTLTEIQNEQINNTLQKLENAKNETKDYVMNNLSIGSRNLILGTEFTTDDYQTINGVGTVERTDQGLKFTAGESEDGFVFPLVFDGCLNGTADYTLSFQYRTNIESFGSAYVMQRTEPNVKIGSPVITPSEDWTLFKWTFSNAEVNDRTCYALGFPYILEGWIEIKEKTLQLEKGTVATDWKVAPEDTEKYIYDTTEEIKKTVSSQSSSIVETSSAIVMSALKNYVQTGAYDEFKKTVESQLSILAGEITAKFTTTTEEINNVNGDLQTKYSEITKYIRASGDGVEIGSSENSIKLVLDNDMIKFTNNGTTFGYWDGENFHTGNIYVDVNQAARFGDFAFTPQEGNGLKFGKVV